MRDFLIFHLSHPLSLTTLVTIPISMSTSLHRALFITLAKTENKLECRMDTFPRYIFSLNKKKKKKKTFILVIASGENLAVPS